MISGRRGHPEDSNRFTHFSNLLSHDGVRSDLHGLCLGPTIPVTGSIITTYEVESAIRASKRNKSGGPSGISPGLLKLLPAA